MDIQLTVAQLGSQSGYAIFNIYDETALSTVIDSKYVSLPISGTGVVDFINLNNQTYVVKTFLSPTTDFNDGTQIGSSFYAYPGQTTTSTLKDDLWLVADSTTGFASGQGNYYDTSLADWVYDIEIPGQGTLQPGVDYNIVSSGGFEMINGYQFQPLEKVVIHFQPNVTSNPSTSSSNAKGLLFESMVTITTDITLDSTHMGKALLIQGVNPTITITLPEVLTIPDNKLLILMSNGGSHIMATITTSAGFIWLGGTKNNLYLGQSEELWIYKNGSSWYIANADGNFKSVGELLESYTTLQPNCLLCNGDVKYRAQYPRLWEYIQNINPDLLVSDTTWLSFDTTSSKYPHVGKFSTGNGTTTFRLPLLMKTFDVSNRMVSSGFTRGIGQPGVGISGIYGDTSIGRNEKDAVGNFFANIRGVIINKAGASNSIITLGNINDYTYGNQYVNNVPFVGLSYNGSTYDQNGETRPFNIGVYKLIRY